MRNLEDIRKLFIEYFIKNDHKHFKSGSLIPHNDNSLLFTNAGMVQFKNIFLGLESKSYNKVVSSQKCLRAGGKHNDLDNVGFTNRHHTFFEMLGNFSFGDYFKEKAIYYAYNFIHKELQISKDKLLVTVYHDDDEAFNFWRKIAGFSEDKIIRISNNDNFWMMGETGPCGPCSEIFYDYGEGFAGGPPGSHNQEGPRFTEIWNLVFMQFNQIDQHKRLIMDKTAVDTGMGLERITAVIEGVNDNYDIEMFVFIIKSISDLLKVKVTNENKTSFKVIADHIRAAIFMISERLTPSNEGRGYVLRRIIRRAVRHGYLLGSREPVFYKLVPNIIDTVKATYPELKILEKTIISTLKAEEISFNSTINDGMKLLEKSLTLVENNILPGKIAFHLYDTFGFPLDLTEDILKKHNFSVNHKGFDSCMQIQKQMSKKSWHGVESQESTDFWVGVEKGLSENFTNSFVGYENLLIDAKIIKIISTDHLILNKISYNQEAYIILNKTPFYPEGGGQIGDRGYMVGSNQLKIEVCDTKKVKGGLVVHKVKVISGEASVGDNISAKVNQEIRQACSINHTATHMMFAAMKKIKGQSVAQQGSLVEFNRLRSDVYLNSPLSDHDIINIENEINKMVLQNLPINISTMNYEQAIKKGANFLMGEQYPDKVRVVSIGEGSNTASMELCGGTHIKNTGEIGLFKIISESGIRAGIRRVEAVTGNYSLKSYQNLEKKIHNLAKVANTNNVNNIELNIQNLIDENKKLKIQVANFYSQTIVDSVLIESKNNPISPSLKVVYGRLDSISLNDLKQPMNNLLNKYKPCILFFETSVLEDGYISFIITASNDIENKIDLQKLLKWLKENHEVKGGGSNKVIQGKIKVNFNHIKVSKPAFLIKELISNYINS